MKILILIVALFCLAHKSYCQSLKVSNNFSITGKVVGKDKGIICLYYRDLDGNKIRDTDKLENGKFFFSGRIKEPTDAALAEDIGSLRLDNPNIIELYLEPSEMSIELKQNDFKNAKVIGSTTQTESRKLDSSKIVLYNLYSNLNKKLSRNSEKIQKPDNGQIIKDSLDLIKRQIKMKDLTFIAQNPNSYLSLDLLVYYLSLKQISLDSAKKMYDHISLLLKKSAASKKIVTAFSNREHNEIGKDTIDFVKKDIFGHTIKLSTFRNKNYVLLDFWASWCAPCFDVNPKIESIFKKYGPKGLILMGISLDEQEIKWKLAIERYNKNKWINFLDSTGPDVDLRSKFDILAIPELVLIDKNDKIVGHYLGEEKNSTLTDLNNTLEAIFRNN